MSLAEGARLGPYEIVAALGAGGMGEVYKARDTRLDRSVAIKILPAALASDPQFRERFDREARAISQLSHPHICTLYDVGEHDGTAFLVMEMLDGDTLSSRLDKAPLPIDQALTYAVQILSALDAAHRAGIVHRDLKPANVMLTKTGAKLLDFGLAKTSAPVVATSGLSMAPTTPPATMTAAGTILGTFQYMAPEQIEGMEADARTDLFAFGCVLYEMLTGRKAFEGKTRASLLGAILKDEPPPVSQLQPSSSPALDRIVATCLAKEPDDRWQTARDVMRELKWVAGNLSTAHVVTPPLQTHSRRRLGGPIAATAIITAAVVAPAIWLVTRTSPPSRPIVRFQVVPSGDEVFNVADPTPNVALSNDGSRMVYTAAVGAGAPLLYVREFDRSDAVALAGTTNGRSPFFSPDGEWVGYFVGGDLRKVSVHGGPPVTLCIGCAPGNRGATWGSDDTIVFASNGGALGLRRIPAAGGEPAAVTTIDPHKGETTHMWPEWLPGREAVLFTVGSTGTTSDSGLIAVRDLKSGDQKVLVRGGSNAHYVPTGHLVFVAAGTVRVVGFDVSTLSVIGNPVPALDHVMTKAVGSANFSVSQTGTLAYIAGTTETGFTTRLVWVDRQGHEEAISAPPRNYTLPRLSPDGLRVALDIRDQQFDIWIWDFQRAVLSRLTTDASQDFYPIWSPDGRRVAFASQRGGLFNVWWQAADGTGVAERLTTSPNVQYPGPFTRDGKSLLIRDTTQSNTDVSILSLEDRRVRPLLHTTFSESNGEPSPDEKWIAYQSNESGQDEIHVRPFPATDSGHWQVSTSGGTRPAWAPNGRELFYVDGRGRLIAVPVQAGATFTAGNPTVVLESTGAVGSGITPGRYYDVAPDGRRFLLIQPAAARNTTAPASVSVVLSWGEELKRLAPTKRP